MRSGLVSFARGFRRNETAAEQRLWSKLRNRQLAGWKFKRQVPFGRYVLDFFCFDARLAIEVDGATHSSVIEFADDAMRTAFLESQGVKVLRCANLDIDENLDGVIEMIYLELGQQAAPSPALCARLSPRGEAHQRTQIASSSGAPKIGVVAPERRPLPMGRGEIGET